MNIVAIDIGGSSGKMFLANYANSTVNIIDEYAFENRPYYKDVNMYVSIDALIASIVDGLRKFSEKCKIDSIGIDTWGGSFVWVDNKCQLLREIYNCRSKRHHANYYELIKNLDNYSLFKSCGVPFARHTILSQLAYESNESLIPKQEGSSFIILSSYLATVFTNKLINDVSAAVDTCLTDITGKNWDFEKIESFNIPKNVFNPIASVGTLNGQVEAQRFKDEKFYGAKVINVAGHDTMSAVASIPNFGENDCFISIGTTIVVGARTSSPIVSEKAYKNDYKNCISLFDINYICTDITGFWVTNQCYKHYKVDGREANIVDLIEASKTITDNESYIDMCDNIYDSTIDDMPELIRQECLKRNMKAPTTLGELGACLFESYALAINAKIEDLLETMGKERFDKIHVISGASRNELLMQDIANALGQSVLAGIPYATLVGNILCQLVGNGIINSEIEMIETANNTSKMKEYSNTDVVKWEHKKQMYKKIFDK